MTTHTTLQDATFALRRRWATSPATSLPAGLMEGHSRARQVFGGPQVTRHWFSNRNSPQFKNRSKELKSNKITNPNSHSKPVSATALQFRPQLTNYYSRITTHQSRPFNRHSCRLKTAFNPIKISRVQFWNRHSDRCFQPGYATGARREATEENRKKSRQHAGGTERDSVRCRGQVP